MLRRFTARTQTRAWWEMFASYRKPWLWSVLLHITLFSLLWLSTFSLPSRKPQPMLAATNTKPVKAFRVDNTAVDHMVEQIKMERQQQATQQRIYQKKLADQAKAAKQARIREQNKLAILQQRKQNIVNQTSALDRAQSKRLAEMEQSYLDQQKTLQDKLRKGEKQLDSLRYEIESKSSLLSKKRQQIHQAETKHADIQKQVLAQKSAVDAQISSEVNRYKALIVRAISQHWILPNDVTSNLSCYFEISLSESGKVMTVKLLRSSGDPLLDRSAQSAIYKSSPLPMPALPQARVLFRTIRLTVRPENIGE